MSTIESKTESDLEKKETVGGCPLFRPARKARRRDVSQTYWAQEQANAESDSEAGLHRAVRMHLLREFGAFSLAYSTAVQPRLNHFGDDDGYIAFRKRWGLTFALGDVVASKSNWETLLDEFVQQHRRVSFCQISESMAEKLSRRGFFINQLGIDTTLKLSEYNFNGKHKEWLRYASNWIAKRGFSIEELSFDQIQPIEVETVSEAWRKTRTIKRKEVRFLNRPIVLKDEPDVRKFFLFSPQNQLLAFVFLDPVYNAGKITGYVTAFKRRHPEAPIYAEQAIMKHVISTLQAEGVDELKLGLSPFAGLEANKNELNGFRSSRTTRWLFQRAFSTRWVNRRFYNVVGHAEYKRRFRGKEEKVYFASNSRFSFSRMLALIGLCGIA